MFTDHMFLAEYDVEHGWSRPTIRPCAPLSIHPAAQVLHYGLSCFEGMKAYHGIDGKMRLFRPELNMQRLKRSAERLQLAEFSPDELLECLKALLRVDKMWLPKQLGHSMYIRPFMFSSADVLGVSKSTKSTLSILLSPVGPYFPSGLKPIRLFIDENRRRAWPGGVGEFKVGGNYATTILPQVEAAEKYGASQVLYTFEEHGQPAVFAESGAMNIFFLIQNINGERELATPPLDGTILPGVTRDSILSLTRQWGEFKVSERQITIAEVEKAAYEKRLLEVFGSGTACIVQPVGELIKSNGHVLVSQATMKGVDEQSTLAARVQQEILDIQYGRHAQHPWTIVID